MLEYSALWTSSVKLAKSAILILDGTKVCGITPSLAAKSRVTGPARGLVRSRGVAFKGAEVAAIDGFTMPVQAASVVLQEDPKCGDVLFPFLNGEDMNTRPDLSARRWIVNFFDWPQERAADYSICFKRIVEEVKPVLSDNNNPQLRDFWWRYKRPAPALQMAIRGLDRVIAIALISKTVMPVMVPTGQVFSHMLGVFATEDTGMLALLSSAPHYWWTLSRASTMKTDVRYTPSDVFETLPLPEVTSEMRALGDRLDRFRRDLMLARQAGLTRTYNMVHDPRCMDIDIVELRQIHEMIDEAVCRAYGWDELVPQLDHGHYGVGRETRYTVGPAVQRELVDRLLELNHERYAAEVAAGLHDKKNKRGRHTRGNDQDGLF
ncbi:hypothetical protein [Actinomadura luteofluorescens]|uniref:hypothetical protein n=1 Tax=Actinomadura luteofluorescens TaxID=46163 RepID=UPI003D8DFE47